MKPRKSANPFEILQAAAQQNQWAATYFLHGEDSFLREKSLIFVRDSFLGSEQDDLRFRQFYFPEASADDIAMELQTLPFFGLTKLIILHDIDAMKEKDWEKIEKSLPTEAGSVLVLITASKLDRRRKVFKYLLEKTEAIELKAPFENQVAGWIKSFATERQKEIHLDAIQLLHRRIGSSLAELDQEVAKLVSYVGDRDSIEMEDVEQVTQNSRTESVFELTEAVGHRQTERSLSLLSRLLDSGQSEVGVVSLIARHFRILMLVKLGQQKKLYDNSLAQFCGVPPYFLRQYTDASRLWQDRALKQALLITAATEKKLKSAPIEAKILLDAMIFDFARTS